MLFVKNGCSACVSNNVQTTPVPHRTRRTLNTYTWEGRGSIISSTASLRSVFHCQNDFVIILRTQRRDDDAWFCILFFSVRLRLLRPALIIRNPFCQLTHTTHMHNNIFVMIIYRCVCVRVCMRTLTAYFLCVYFRYNLFAVLIYRTKTDCIVDSERIVCLVCGCVCMFPISNRLYLY